MGKGWSRILSHTMIFTASSVSWIGGSHECDDDVQMVYLILGGLLHVLPFLSILPTLFPFLSESGEATPKINRIRVSVAVRRQPVRCPLGAAGGDGAGAAPSAMAEKIMEQDNCGY